MRFTKMGSSGLIIFLFTVFFLVSTMAGQDNITIPQTPAGIKLLDFLDVFNTGDTDKYYEFIENNHVKSDDPRRSTEARVEIYQTLFNDLGPLEIRRIVNSEDNSITVLLKAIKPAPRYDWLEFTLTADEDNPDLINSFQVHAVMPPLDLPDKRYTDEEFD